jgi:hypothetical protein
MRVVAVQRPQHVFRRSGYRFADENTRQAIILEHVPVPQEPDML